MSITVQSLLSKLLRTGWFWIERSLNQSLRYHAQMVNRCVYAHRFETDQILSHHGDGAYRSHVVLTHKQQSTGQQAVALLQATAG